MLKIVHLVAGALALLLSFVPSLGNDSLSYLQQADAIYLSLIGLINLSLAPFADKGANKSLQSAVSALLVLGTALQTVALLAPLHSIGGQPAILLGLLAAGAAVLLHLFGNLGQSRPQAVKKVRKTVKPEKPIDMSNRETGTVKWFNTSKGFGFIARDSGEDIFVHFRAIRGEGHRALVEGQRVEFTVMQRDKGLQAEDVIVASAAERR